jgi:hypothetical protein
MSLANRLGFFRPRASRRRKAAFTPRAERLEDRVVLSARLQLSGAQAIGPGAPVDVSNVGAASRDQFSEMTVAVDPTNPLNLAGFSHRFVPAAGGGFTFTVIDVFHSSDGGLTWATTPIGGADDSFGFSANVQRFDPAIKFDAIGTLYIAYGVDDGTFTRLVVAHSINGGATFGSFTVVDRERDLTVNHASVPGVDQWQLATGPDRAATFGQVVYVAYSQNIMKRGVRDQPIVVAGSKNSGVTFTTPVIVNDDSKSNGISLDNDFADPAVGPNGELYVSWTHENTTAGIHSIMFASDLAGLFSRANSFGKNVTVLACKTDLNLTHEPPQPHRGINNGPIMDVDRSGGPYNGFIYIAFTDKTVVAPAADTDIYLARSINGGSAWVPATVDTSLSTEFMPAVAVDQASGSVNVLYYTTAGDPAGVSVRARLATSIDGGITFPASAFLSTTRSNATGAAFRNDYLEYIGVAVYDGTAHGLWAQNQGAGTKLEAFTADASFTSATRGNQLIVNGDDRAQTKNDAIILRRSAVNRAYEEVVVNGVVQYDGLFATLDSIVVNGGEGDDTLTIDFGDGTPGQNPIPAGGLTFHGGLGNDRIIAAKDANFTLTQTSLSITGVAPITLDSVEEAQLTGGAGNNTFTIGTIAGTTIIDGGAGTNTVVINGSVPTSVFSAANVQNYQVIAGGNLDLAKDFVVPNLTLAGGSIVNTGKLTVTGQLTWTDGTMSGRGRTVVNAIAISGPAAKYLDGRNIEISGAGTWTGQGNITFRRRATWTNLPGSTFALNNDATVFALNGGGRFRNQGTMVKSNSAGTSTFEVGFDNGGMFQVHSGTVVLDGSTNRVVPRVFGTYDLAAGTTLKLNRPGSIGGGTDLEGGNAVTGAGTLELVGGVTDITGATITAKQVYIDLGARLDGSQGAVINADVFNSGTLDLPSPTSAGVTDFTINGNYEQLGTLQVVLITPTRYSRLDVTGTFRLNATLNVQVVPGFVPQPADVFTIIIGSSLLGRFSNESGLGLGNGQHLIVNYSQTEITLGVSGP